MGQKISDFREPKHLFPEDLIPMVQKGENVAINLDHFVHELQNILNHIPGSALCVARNAQIKATLAEGNVNKAIISSNKALETAQNIYNKYGNIQKDYTDIKDSTSKINVDIDILKDQIKQLKLLLDSYTKSSDITVSVIEDPLVTKYIIKSDKVVIATITVPVIDTTLSLAGCSADAKATGDAITSLDNKIESLKGAYIPITGGVIQGNLTYGTTVINNNQIVSDKFVKKDATDSELLAGDGSLASPIDSDTIINLKS